MRFDLPAAEEGVEKCHVTLADGKVTLSEVRCFLSRSSGQFDAYMGFWQLNDRGEELITIYFDVVIYEQSAYARGTPSSFFCCARRLVIC